MLRGLTLVMLVALVAVGCEDNPAAPANQVEATAPTPNFMNGPDQPGPIVNRTDAGTVLVWNFFGPATPDGEDWVVMFGIDTDELPNLQSCGGDGVDVGDIQEIIRDHHYNIHQFRKQVPAYAAHVSDFDAYEWCDKAYVPWLAIGEASVVWTGNMRVSQDGSPGRSKLSFNARLDDVDTGRTYHAHWNFMWAWPPFQVLADNSFIK